MIEAFCLGHRLRQGLAGRIGERAPGEAERVDLDGRRFFPITFEEVGGAGDFRRQSRGEVLAHDQAVRHGAELDLDRRHQHADHRAAHHLRRQPDLVGGADDADVVRRIGADIDDIRIGGPYRAHHRREIGCARRIALVVDDLEAVLLDFLAGAVRGALGELGVGGEDRDGLWLGCLRRGEIEEADREGVDALRTNRDHREVFRVAELIVDADGGETDRHLVVLDDDRHRRRNEVGAVGSEQQVDFVDGDELGVDVRYIRRRALVVIDDELDRAAEQPALGVDVVAPDLKRGVDHLARRGPGAREREAHADPDRIAALRGRPGNETKSDDERSAKAAQRAAAKLHDRFLPLIPEAGCPPFGIALRRRFIGAALFPTCAFPPVLRRPNSSPHWGLVSRPLAAAAGHGAQGRGSK